VPEIPYHCKTCERVVFHARPGREMRWKIWKHSQTKRHRARARALKEKMDAGAAAGQGGDSGVERPES
jgi:hypothetical protein